MIRQTPITGIKVYKDGCEKYNLKKIIVKIINKKLDIVIRNNYINL